MKTNLKLSSTLLLLSIALACSKKSEDNGHYQESVTDTISVNSTESLSKSAEMSSSAAKENPNSKRKFIRTADAKFKVKNVMESTFKIETLTSKFGGFVTLSDLKSEVSDTDETQISKDSLVKTTRFIVNNTLSLRVPNIKLDTLLKNIAKEVQFLDYRVIKADDVNLQLLANNLSQNRNQNQANRVTNAINNKGKKLNDINDAEENLANIKEKNDNAAIENLSLKDQVNFSTVTLQLYQNEQLKTEMVVNEQNINAYRPNLGLQIWESIKSGWFVFEAIIAFLVQIWPLFLISFLGWFGYKKVTGRKSS